MIEFHCPDDILQVLDKEMPKWDIIHKKTERPYSEGRRGLEMKQSDGMCPGFFRDDTVTITFLGVMRPEKPVQSRR